MLKVTINEYLKKIEAEAAQRPIPSAEKLAQAAGVSLPHYYKWAGNRTTNVSRSIPCGIIAYLHSLGFDTELTDILRCDGE